MRRFDVSESCDSNGSSTEESVSSSAETESSSGEVESEVAYQMALQEQPLGCIIFFKKKEQPFVHPFIAIAIQGIGSRFLKCSSQRPSWSI